MSDKPTPRTDQLVAALKRRNVSMHSDYCDMVAHSCKLESELEQAQEQNRKLHEALTTLMPFVLEDYYPHCATTAYVDAVENAKRAIDWKEQQPE